MPKYVEDVTTKLSEMEQKHLDLSGIVRYGVGGALILHTLTDGPLPEKLEVFGDFLEIILGTPLWLDGISRMSTKKGFLDYIFNK